MDMSQIMKQAEEFQKKMASMQSELADRTVSATVGGGMVSATVNGHGQVVELKIEKELIDPEDPDMLRDLVVSAVNEAIARSKEMVQSEMGRITGGINLPGLF